jgi:hypothetical protein
MTDITLKEIAQRARVESAQPSAGNAVTRDYYFPDLPGEARLSDKLLAQGEKAGSWLTAYTDFANQASPMTAPEHHQILGLTLVATAIARRVKLVVSTDDIYPNIYSLIIGSSGDSKSGATRHARKTGRQAGLALFELPGYMSPQGLLKELIGSKPDSSVLFESSDLEELKLRQKFAAQRVLFLDESASLFEWFGQEHMRGIKQLILRLYDCPDEERETTASRGSGTARNCYLNICGVSTPTDIAPFMKSAEFWGNGVWARFNFVTPSWDKPPYIFYPDVLTIPSELPELLKNLAFSRLPMPHENKPAEAITVSLANGVYELWQIYDKAVRYDLVNSSELSNRYKSNYKRFPRTLIKTAILLATLDWTGTKRLAPIVEKSHFARAYLLTEQWRESLHRLLEIPNKDGQDDSLETKALRFIPLFASNMVITERELALKLNLSDANERPIVGRLVEQMQKDQLIVVRTVNHAGTDGSQRKRTGFCRAELWANA